MSTSQRPLVLVQGAQGETGFKIVQAFRDQNVSIRAGVSDMNHPNVQRLKQLPFVEVCPLDLEEPNQVVDAVKGVDKVVVIPPYVEKMKEWCYRIFTDSINAGVSHLVLVSSIRGTDITKCHYARVFHAIESRLESYVNLPHTILRCPLFMDVLFNFAEDIKSGKFLFPEGISAPLAIDDLSNAVVCAITNRKETATFEITGPELLKHSDIPKILANTLGKQIEFFPANLESRFRNDLVNRRIALHKADAFMEHFMWYNQGDAAVTSDYEKLVGKKGMTLVEFIKKYKDSFVA